MSGFVFLPSFKEALDCVPVEDRLQMYELITDYGLTGNRPEAVDGYARAILMLIGPTLEAQKKRYEANIENGKKGGRPKKTVEEKTQNNPTETEKNPTITQNNPTKTQSKPKITQPKPNRNQEKEKEKEKEKDKEKDIEKEKEKGKVVSAERQEPFFGDLDIDMAFRDLLRHRKTIKVRNTELSVKKLISKLSQYPKDTILEAINDTITNGWRGVFPESVKKKPASSSTNDDPFAQALSEIEGGDFF